MNEETSQEARVAVDAGARTAEAESRAKAILRQADLTTEKFYYDSGCLQYKAGDYLAAALLFGRAIERNPKNYAAFRCRAKAYKKQRKIAECVEDLKTIPEGSSEYAYAQYALGQLTRKGLISETAKEESEKYYSRAYKAYCERKKSLGVAYYRLGKMFEFGLGVEQNPNKARRLYELSTAGEKHHKFEKAQERWREIENQMRPPSKKEVALCANVADQQEQVNTTSNYGPWPGDDVPPNNSNSGPRNNL